MSPQVERTALAAVERSGAVVAEVAGEGIDGIEVLRKVKFFFPRQYDDAVSAVITERVVELELQRLAWQPDLSGLDRQVEDELESQRKEIKKRLGASATLEEYLTARYDIDLEGYRAQLRQAAITSRLSSLLARHHQLRQERREIRRIVLSKLEVARDVHSQLRDGADFSALVRLKGRGDRDRDGRLPPLTRQELEEPVLSAVFGLEEGELSPVLELVDGSFTIVRLLRIHPPITSGPQVSEERLVADLSRHPLEERELLAWNAGILRRYGIRHLR